MTGHPALVAAACMVTITINNAEMLTVPPLPDTAACVEIVALTCVLLVLMAVSVIRYHPERPTP